MNHVRTRGSEQEQLTPDHQWRRRRNDPSSPARVARRRTRAADWGGDRYIYIYIYIATTRRQAGTVVPDLDYSGLEGRPGQRTGHSHSITGEDCSVLVLTTADVRRWQEQEFHDELNTTHTHTITWTRVVLVLQTLAAFLLCLFSFYWKKEYMSRVYSASIPTHP